MTNPSVLLQIDNHLSGIKFLSVIRCIKIFTILLQHGSKDTGKIKSNLQTSIVFLNVH